MYEINLIRQKSILPETRKKVYQVFIASLVIFGLVIFILISRTIGYSIRISKLRDQKNTIGITINNMINEYSIEQWGEEWVGFYNDMSLISKIYEEKTYWSIRLNKFTELLPPNMSIDKMIIGNKANGMSATIFALIDEEEGDYEPIKRFIDILEHSTLFGKGIRLESQQRTQLETKTVNLIQITVPVKED